MSEMIERVAKAIHNSFYSSEDVKDCPFCMKAAKAAIEAMRDLVKCDPEGNAMDNMYLNGYIDRALKE